MPRKEDIGGGRSSCMNGCGNNAPWDLCCTHGVLRPDATARRETLLRLVVNSFM